MNHQDHVQLLRDGIPLAGGVWADMGSGTGAFTLALAELLGSEAQIYSIDRDAQALKQQARHMQQHFPNVTVHYHHADFTSELELPPLDGIVMANSLHFYRDKRSILATLLGHLKSAGIFILVEYDVDNGNTWVPYPLSYATWATEAPKHGLSKTHFLHRITSRFLNAIYAAASEKM